MDYADILQVTPEIKLNVRKIFGLDEPGRLEDSIRTLDEWVKKQSHFTDTEIVSDKEYLERALLFGKGSVEKAKEHIDRLCTFKTTMPVFFACTNLSEINIVFDSCHFTILPKLTPDHYRVIIAKILNTNFDVKTFIHLYQFMVILCEFLKSQDYSAGYIFLNDYREINVTDIVTKIDFLNLPQFMSIVIQGYGGIIKGIHFITPSKLIENVIKIMKQFMSEKIGKRIHAFNDVEDLQKNIPKEILPSDFGGDEKSIKEFHDDLIKALSTPKFENYLKDVQNARTDESRRSKDQFNDQYMGLPGSFRSLIVD